MNKDILTKIKETTFAHELFGSDNPLLLMVSGGSDSTALAYLIAELKREGETGPIAMLHVDHQLRGEEAKQDARFVADLAEQLEIPFFLCEIDIASEAKRTGDNVEALARHERYKAANEALASHCLHTSHPISDGRIVTAHTSDDRIENFYMRSIVGTGPGGFRSMLYKNGQVVRPLLDLSREDLRQYISQLDESGQALKDDKGNLWREDATNAHTDRFRAYVRHKIIPKAREWSASSDANLIRSMNLIADEDDMLNAMTDEIIDVDVIPLFLADENADEDTRGYLLTPSFGRHARPMQRRVVQKLFKNLLGADERIDASTVEGTLDGFSEDGSINSGYVTNVQGNIAISANKQGVRIEPMADFRARRKRD